MLGKSIKYGAIALILLTTSNYNSKMAAANRNNIAENINDQKDNTPKFTGLTIPITIKLTSPQRNSQQVDNQASILLNMENTSRKTISIEVSQISVLVGGSNIVLMSATPEDLGSTARILLQPGEKKTFQYRLRSKYQLPPNAQTIVALVYYRQDAKSQQVAASNSEQLPTRNR